MRNTRFCPGCGRQDCGGGAGGPMTPGLSGATPPLLLGSWRTTPAQPGLSLVFLLPSVRPLQAGLGGQEGHVMVTLPPAAGTAEPRALLCGGTVRGLRGEVALSRCPSCYVDTTPPSSLGSAGGRRTWGPGGSCGHGPAVQGGGVGSLCLHKAPFAAITPGRWQRSYPPTSLSARPAGALGPKLKGVSHC